MEIVFDFGYLLGYKVAKRRESDGFEGYAYCFWFAVNHASQGYFVVAASIGGSYSVCFEQLADF